MFLKPRRYVYTQESNATWPREYNGLAACKTLANKGTHFRPLRIRPRPALQVERCACARALASTFGHPALAALAAPIIGLPCRVLRATRHTRRRGAAMGLAASLPEESAYAPFQALGLGYTEELVRSYKERDLDFGIDLPTIEGLTGLDRDQCIQLVECLAKNDPRSGSS